MTYLLLFIPFAILILINLFPREKRTEPAFWLGLAVLVFQAGAVVASQFGYWGTILTSQLESVFGFNLQLYKMGHVLVMASALAGATALLVARATLKNKRDRFNFVGLLLVSLIGINGIAMVTDIFTLYIFIEVTALATFILIMLNREQAAFEGAFKYLIMSVVATVLMLAAVSLFILIGGGTSFLDVKMAVISDPLAYTALLLFLCGLFIKGGMVPFHGWLPDAYSSAPTAVSVWLAGIVTKASGIYALIRLMVIFGGLEPLQNIMLTVGAASIVIGALAALGQKELKRLLAYSSISQMGYIVIALGSGTVLGIFAALFHFFNHTLFKATLFANVAAVEEQTGTQEMEKLGGLAQKMPITGLTSAIASLSTAGLPPLSGFWSKLLIIIALWISGHYFFAAVAVLASVVTLAYFLLLQRQAFFGLVPAALKEVREAGPILLIPAVFLSLLIVVIGLVFPFMIQMVLR
ncbi:MAG: proton-conducting transporter membrane subunit [Candidatus Margulisbacteria bacterium]|nr:proton-conducting transporter membrane subunit [Candidatus Margulisiibacteriota bacterium]